MSRYISAYLIKNPDVWDQVEQIETTYKKNEYWTVPGLRSNNIILRRCVIQNLERSGVVERKRASHAEITTGELRKRVTAPREYRLTGRCTEFIARHRERRAEERRLETIREQTPTTDRKSVV